MKTRAIDTNILVRSFVRDDSRQWEIAAAIFKTSQVVILPSVLIETEWVLRRSFQLGRLEITAMFRSLLASEAVSVVDRANVELAIDAFEHGMDFADAMHVCLVPAGAIFITFDRDLVRLANHHINTASVELAI